MPSKRLPLDRNVSISIVDGGDTLIYSTRKPYDKVLIRCSFFEVFKNRAADTAGVRLAADPRCGRRPRHVSFATLKDIGWHVFVGRGKDTIIAETASYITQTITIAALLFLFAILMALYIFADASSCKPCGTYLRAEKNLLSSESRFRELFDHMSSGVAIYEAVSPGEAFSHFFRHEQRGYRSRACQMALSVNCSRPTPVSRRSDCSGSFNNFGKREKPCRFPCPSIRINILNVWVENYVSKLPSGHIFAVFG